MFERFTEEARQAVVAGQDEARRLRHNYVGTEHLLLGILGVDGVGRHALEARGVELAHLRKRVGEVVGAGPEVVTGQIPFSPRAKSGLEHSLRRAVEMGHGHIGPGHLLLGLISQNEGGAIRFLEESGTGLARSIEADVLRLLTRETAAAARCEQALLLYGAQFVCQKDRGHAGEHVEHGDGWTMRWDRE